MEQTRIKYSCKKSGGSGCFSAKPAKKKKKECRFPRIMHSLSSFSDPSASGSDLPGFGLKPAPFLFLLLLRSDAPDRQPAFYTCLYFPGRPIRPVTSDTGIRNQNSKACVTRSRKIRTPARRHPAFFLPLSHPTVACSSSSIRS